MMPPLELGVGGGRAPLRRWWTGIIDLQALLAPSDKRQLVPTQRIPLEPNGVAADLGPSAKTRYLGGEKHLAERGASWAIKPFVAVTAAEKPPALNSSFKKCSPPARRIGQISEVFLVTQPEYALL
jgi:hypothetical protein